MTAIGAQFMDHEHLFQLAVIIYRNKQRMWKKYEYLNIKLNCPQAVKTHSYLIA